MKPKDTVRLSISCEVSQRTAKMIKGCMAGNNKVELSRPDVFNNGRIKVGPVYSGFSHTSVDAPAYDVLLHWEEEAQNDR